MGGKGKVALAALMLVLAFPLAIAMIGSDDGGPLAENAGGFVSDAVPEEYREFDNKAGSICSEVTPDLIAAQIEAESQWNPKAGSHAGAQGISQFMPGTWKTAGKDGDGDGKADVFNPADAIFSQGHMMCDLVSQVKSLIESDVATGDVIELALAGYNAGIGKVTASGGVPNIKETRGYIEKITSLRATKYQEAPVMVAASEDIQNAINFARKQIGKPYRGHAPGPGCGSFGPACWDCCGLVKGAYESVGLTLPMSTPGNPPATAKCEYALYTRYQEFGGRRVPATRESLRPGDIMFFQSVHTSPAYDNVTHVAIYIGNDQLLDAIPSAGVSIRNVKWPHGGTDKILPEAVRIGPGK